MYSLNVSTERIIQWMNVIRDENEFKRYRLLENFWASQLRSKSWLINTVNQKISDIKGNVYIFGGWYGILAQFIVDNLNIEKVYSIDIDDECRILGNKLSGNDKKIIFLTENMRNFTNYINPTLIINTSTEHVSLEVYNEWMYNVPVNVPVILQGNNFSSWYEHIRCYDTLEEFNKHSKLNNIIFTDILDCIQFQRFMTIGYKNDGY